MSELTRQDLLDLCERAAVPQDKWLNRDSESAQRQVGECWALLRSGCEFHLADEPEQTERTVWVRISSQGFDYFEGGGFESHLFYLPTSARLDASDGKDWY